MLELIREKAPRWLVSLILLLLVVPFALWGVNSYVQPAGNAEAARVGDVAISVDALQQALRQEGQRLRQSLGDAYSPALLDDPATRRTVLDGLVNRELLALDAQARRLQVSDAEVLTVIQQADAFAGENGFDRVRYESVLRRQGLTPVAFEADLKRSLALQQIQGGLAGSAFMSDAELNGLAALWFERRDLRLATLDWRQFTPKTPPDEAAIQAYFDTHKADLMTDEQVRVAYLELKLDAMAAELTVDDATLAKRYEELRSELGNAEQRQVRHILIKIPPDATPEAVEQAREKAVALRAQLSAGADFGALAKVESADSGSADQGGDLGYVERGSMEPQFEEAAFALPLNTVSEPVRTRFGFHLIEVTGIKPAAAPPLAEIQDTLRQRVQRELAEERFFAAVETLRTQSFEHPDTLAPAADALGLTVQELGPITRRGGVGLAGHPEFLRQAFSDEVIGGDNSEVFEVGDGHYVVLRVVEHMPSAQRPLAEVKAEIRARLEQQTGAAAARAAGEALVAKLRTGAAIDTELATHGAAFVSVPDVGREGKQGIADAVLKKAFVLPVVDGAPSYGGVELDNGNYVIVGVSARRPGTAASNAEAREALRRQLLAIRADQALTAELAALRELHPVRVLNYERQ